MSNMESQAVLIVDDEALVRELLRTVLEGEGLDVLEARDGREGLEVFKGNQSRIDLVILDLNMPEMTGYDMQAELQLIDPDVKMIVVTGYMPDEERLVGVEEIISKPVQIPKMSKDVQSCTRNLGFELSEIRGTCTLPSARSDVKNRIRRSLKASESESHSRPNLEAVVYRPGGGSERCS